MEKTIEMTRIILLAKTTAIPGFYLYTEVSDPRQVGERAILETRPGAFAGYQGPFLLQFWYHMLGDGIGTLRVLVTEIGGATTERYSRTGQGEWYFMNIHQG